MDRYKILADYHIEDLESKVNSYIKEGYSPLGRVVIDEGHRKYLQAMFKLEVNNVYEGIVISLYNKIIKGKKCQN